MDGTTALAMFTHNYIFVTDNLQWCTRNDSFYLIEIASSGPGMMRHIQAYDNCVIINSNEKWLSNQKDHNQNFQHVETFVVSNQEQFKCPIRSQLQVDYLQRLCRARPCSMSFLQCIGCAIHIGEQGDARVNVYNAFLSGKY